MPAPYPLHLRRRIVRAYDKNEGSVRELAQRFAVAAGTVEHYLQLRRQTGALAPRPHGGGRHPRVDREHLEDLRRLTYERPDATLAEIAAAFSSRLGIQVSRSAIHRAVQRLRRAA